MIYSNAINISVIIGSMMADSTKTLQFISVTVLKIIFLNVISEKLDSGRMAWMLRLWTPGSLNSGPLDSASLKAWTRDVWTLGAWTLGLCTLGRLDNRLTFNNYTFVTKGIL